MQSEMQDERLVTTGTSPTINNYAVAITSAIDLCDFLRFRKNCANSAGRNNFLYTKPMSQIPNFSVSCRFGTVLFGYHLLLSIIEAC